MITKKSSNLTRKKRHLRIRKALKGTPERPRLCVFRSNSNMYAQIIDDTNGVTLVAASTLDKDINFRNVSNIESAKAVGKLVAEKALANNIKDVVFDRAGYLYHGRVKALADAAREAGLNF
jgi:large subunit ribosomal protein L18